MSLALTNDERNILEGLRRGVRRIEIFKVGRYPSAVSFETSGGEWVTLRAREVSLAPRFEVFPLSVVEGAAGGMPVQKMETREFTSGCSVAILQKTEWDLLSSEEESRDMVGDQQNATIQREGKPTEMPPDVLHSVSLHAGIELVSSHGQRSRWRRRCFPLRCMSVSAISLRTCREISMSGWRCANNRMLFVRYAGREARFAALHFGPKSGR